LKRLSILGSTGSIGVNTLDVVSHCADHFTVIALAAGRNLKRLIEQITLYKPQLVSVSTETAARELKKLLPRDRRPDIVFGDQGLHTVASISEVDLVVSAIVGAAGLIPTLTAIKHGKDVGLANKETLVMAGKIVMQEARNNNVKIIPIDSEHSALFQLLARKGNKQLKSIVLTASGGPFLKHTYKQLLQVTREAALKHPNWKMGHKVTIDSATLMNKGLEVIEAKWLFSIPLEKINVFIHPQSIVHALVEYIDGSVIAHLSYPDMRGPIAYALNYPKRMSTHLKPLNLLNIGTLNFIPPNSKKFPSLQLAYRALEDGETMPAVLNAANEVAVSAFLKKNIRFVDIPRVTEKTMDLFHPKKITSLEDVLTADKWARQKAQTIISQLH
jgi:1-deoxy-D-xylulose-5-phosphate reductoisomerase